MTILIFIPAFQPAHFPTRSPLIPFQEFREFRKDGGKSEVTSYLREIGKASRRRAVVVSDSIWNLSVAAILILG